MTVKPRTLHRVWMVLTVIWCVAVLAYEFTYIGPVKDLALVIMYGLAPAFAVWIVGWLLLKVTGRLNV